MKRLHLYNVKTYLSLMATILKTDIGSFDSINHGLTKFFEKDSYIEIV